MNTGNDSVLHTIAGPEAKGEIVLYQPDETIRLEVRMEGDTVWLTQQQIADLFCVKQPAISKHLKNIFASGELYEPAVHSILEYTASDGKQYKTKFYNLDAILSVGYRVNSKNATLFRQWANKVLKNYIIHGYSVNQRFERHNAQYAPITVNSFNRAHDRFLLIDHEVYHIGASLKDLGRKWFAFTLMQDLTAGELINRI